jgi:UDP-N-acetylglucosamine 4-epimerase
MFNKNLYNTPFHKEDLRKHTFLITGGAGFIGSNLVEYLLRHNAGMVRVLDNLSNGYFENLKEFIDLPNFEFINGDIRDYLTCIKAVDGIDFVSHQAALGSVPRSINDPITTNEVNISGFLNILNAVKESKTVKKMVYAASSSTYGNSIDLPKIEGREGDPLSPYAVTKLVNELYAEVFFKVYKLQTIGLRYFNVFGPKQNPNNPYAAVIPIFAKSFINNISPKINGDGETSRDFTFIENVVQANIKALLTKEINSHQVYNVACGDRFSLNQIVQMLNLISKKKIKPIYDVERIGDVKHSMASIDKIKVDINYNPTIRFEEGLRIVYDWYLQNMNI